MTNNTTDATPPQTPSPLDPSPVDTPVIYQQSTGLIWYENLVLARGYSGYLGHKNNPDAQHAVNSGPIPRGLWQIFEPYDSKSVGPLAFPLSPVNHNAESRTYFRIHGDSKSRPGDASRGCIILPRKTREFLQLEIARRGSPLKMWVIE